MNRYQILIHKLYVILANFYVWYYFSLRSIFAELLALKERHIRAGRAGPVHDRNRFRGWKQTFFLLWTICLKCFVFEICGCFFFHTVTGGSLAISICFASLATRRPRPCLCCTQWMNKIFSILIACHHQRETQKRMQPHCMQSTPDSWVTGEVYRCRRLMIFKKMILNINLE